MTLGISEKAAIENLKNIALQLAAQEEQARERLCASIDVQDTIARSLGILRTALVISHDEALDLLSNVRMGVLSGQITDVKTDVIDDLMTEIEPATLSVSAGKNLSFPQEALFLFLCAGFPAGGTVSGAGRAVVAAAGLPAPDGADGEEHHARHGEQDQDIPDVHALTPVPAQGR